jgi:hypothetical protein
VKRKHHLANVTLGWEGKWILKEEDVGWIQQ